MKKISDILSFRTDVSPFLVHLTRDQHEMFDACQSLTKILCDEKLISGNSRISDIQYGGFTNKMDDDELKKYFSSVCFTETPLSEIYCLFDIEGRTVNLEPYGLVFIKEKLQHKNVSPVLYLNNTDGSKDKVVQAIFSLIGSHPEEAKDIVPLFSIFGKKIKHPATKSRASGIVDFRWEREWRYPASKGDFKFDYDDIFVGLCPDDKIASFEEMFSPLCFIDPSRPIKWYAKKLIEARKRTKLKVSVV